MESSIAVFLERQAVLAPSTERGLWFQGEPACSERVGVVSKMSQLVMSSDKVLEPLRAQNENLLEESFKNFRDLPAEIRALAVDKSIPSQALHAAKHYRNHLNRDNVIAALMEDGDEIDSESIIQATLAKWFMQDYMNDGGIIFIEMGLKPTYEPPTVDLGHAYPV